MQPLWMSRAVTLTLGHRGGRFLGTLRGVSYSYRRYPKCFHFVRTHAGDAWSSHLNLNITSFRGRKSQSILYHNMVLGMSLLYKESDNI